MVQSVTVFVDSTLFVEYNKNTRYELLEKLFVGSFELVYNQVVMSEYLYHFIGYHGTKSPRSLKENRSIPQVLAGNNPLTLLELFEQLTSSLPAIFIIPCQKEGITLIDSIETFQSVFSVE